MQTWKTNSSTPGTLVRRTLYRLVDEPARPVNFPDASDRAAGISIPKTLLQTWEINEFGKRHARQIERLINLNPDISFCFFDAKTRDEYVGNYADPELKSLYFASIHKPMQVDIFRYLHVFREGGFYLDISMGWKTPISSMVSESDTGLISFERNKSVFHAPKQSFENVLRPLNLACMWGFGFAPNHPLLSHTLQYIRERHSRFLGFIAETPKDAIVSLTGPAAFTHGVWEHLRTKDASLRQWDYDFLTSGYRLSGAGYRHSQFPSYARIQKGPIIYTDGAMSQQPKSFDQ